MCQSGSDAGHNAGSLSSDDHQKQMLLELLPFSGVSVTNHVNKLLQNCSKIGVDFPQILVVSIAFDIWAEFYCRLNISGTLFAHRCETIHMKLRPI